MRATPAELILQPQVCNFCYAEPCIENSKELVLNIQQSHLSYIFVISYV